MLRGLGFLTRALRTRVPAIKPLPAPPAIMNPPTSNACLGSEFDAFLFAPIGEDRNGLPLSIVSLLGRMDLDPWEEAASLAGLPAEAAVQKLASLLAALHLPSLKQGNAGTMAIRLIALLPPPTGRAARSLEMVRVSDMVHPGVLMIGILFALWTIWLLSMPVVTAVHDAPSQVDALHAPATPLAAPSQTPTTTSGR